METEYRQPIIAERSGIAKQTPWNTGLSKETTPESQSHKDYLYYAGEILLAQQVRPLSMEDLRKFVSMGLQDVKEEIGTHTLGVGELQNRGNVTLGAIQTQFERAQAVLDKQRKNPDSVAWVLTNAAEELYKNYGADKKQGKEVINRNLKRITEIAGRNGIGFETPKI